MNFNRVIIVLVSSVILSSCAMLRGVRQQDLDAWRDVPVEALDTHSFFLTVPMVRTKSDGGIEIRNYANGKDISSCTGYASANAAGSWVNANSFSNCSSEKIVCNNIFYIKNGKVIEYAPTGSCYTDETVQPQPRYKLLKATN